MPRIYFVRSAIDSGAIRAKNTTLCLPNKEYLANTV